MAEKKEIVSSNVLLTGAAIIASLSFLVMILFQSLTLAIDTPIFHLDGAFQTASGLFRLDAGQSPGRDFYPYLGIAPLYLIFPIFKLAGSTLFASVFAARFITIVLGWLAVSLLWHLIIQPRRLIFSLAGGAVLLCLMKVIEVSVGVPDIAFALFPGNSLKPVRASAPYLAVAATYFLISRYPVGAPRNILLGLVVGIVLLWSNDFAIPTAGLLLIFYFLYFYRRERLTWISSSTSVFFVGLFSWVILFFLATAGHPFELLTYNFVDVATDQWWYFGSYGSTSRVFDVTQILRIFDRTNYFPTVVLLSVCVIALRTKRTEHVLNFMIGLIVFAGGCLASVGGHIGDYFGAFMFWGAATAVLGMAKIIFDKIVNKQFFNFVVVVRAKEFVLIGLALVFILAAWYKGVEYKKGVDAAEADPRLFYVPEFNSFMQVEWKPYVEYIRLNKGKSVIEDYWGIWSSLNRQFSTWPVDSAIHALGRVRSASQAKLASADIIVSTKYSTSPLWQPWSFSQNFWFYEELLVHWMPVFESPSSVVWRKTAQPRNFSRVACQVTNDGNGIVVGDGDDGFYAVTLQYSSSGAGRRLIMMRNNISFADDAGGYVSIPPAGSEIKIPVLVTKRNNNFESKVVGSDKVRLTIDACSAEKINFKDDNVLRVDLH